MSNKVDKLFKDKLGEHSLPPSAQAWGKIEANLAKKNKGIIWFRIAAVLALLGLLTFVWMRNEKEALPQQMATQPPVRVEKEDSASLKQEKPLLTHQTVEDEKQNNTVYKKQKQSTTKQQTISTKANTEVTNIAVIKEEQKVEEKKTEVAAISNEVTTAKVAPQKSIKLTFSLPSLKADVNETAPALIAAAEPEEKKSSLQKAVNDIRTGDVFGSLRDAKDDLFAWEFKKDKIKKTLN